MKGCRTERCAFAYGPLAGKPVIISGDGTNPWTLARSEDLASPFTNLLGNGKALGEIFHITGDKGFAWNDIYHAIARGLGVKARAEGQTGSSGTPTLTHRPAPARDMLKKAPSPKRQ